MKLTKVKTFVVQTPPPHSGGSFWFFVKLETDTGLVGWGETAVLGTLHGLEDSYEMLVSQVFEGYLEGKNPIDRETLYHKMYDGMMAVVMGMAAQHAATTHETVLISDILEGKIGLSA